MTKYLKRFLCLILFSVSLLASTSYADDDALQKGLNLITEDILKEYAGYLAGDELEGRNSGYPGNDKATEYIAEKFKTAGLKPVLTDKKTKELTYYQYFKVGGKKTRNCVAILEGSDEKLKNEIIVVGAHHDHVGMKGQRSMGQGGGAKKKDKIWNGADDNASGTSGVLALAKAFGESGVKPKRTIIFITYSGEEWGLIGSARYTKKPAFKIDQYVAMINLDMIGRNPEDKVAIAGFGSFSESKKMKKLVQARVKETGLNARYSNSYSSGDSDFASWYKKKVPGIFFFTGFHDDYHRVTDHADKLAYDNMEKIVRTVFLIINDWANMDKLPPFVGKKTKIKLGIIYCEPTEEEIKALALKEGQEALKVESIKEDSIAQKAGLQKDDIILSLNGKELPSKDTVRFIYNELAGLEKGTEIDIVVYRNKDRVSLKLKIPAEEK